MTVSINLDDADAQRIFRMLKELGGDLSKPLRQSGRNLEQQARQGFRNESDPFGTPWAPHSPVTKQMRERRGRTGVSVLSDFGKLYGTIRSESDATSATLMIGGPGSWAAVHQSGNPNNRMFGRARAPIPARPMFPEQSQGLPQPWLEAILDPIDRALEKAIAA